MRARHARELWALAVGLGVALVMMAEPAYAVTCHAHSHAHDSSGAVTTVRNDRDRRGVPCALAGRHRSHCLPRDPVSVTIE